VNSVVLCVNFLIVARRVLNFSCHAYLTVQTSNKVEKIVLAVKDSTFPTKGMCSALVKVCSHTYDDVKFSAVNGLLWDIIFGRGFLTQHKCVQLNCGGSEHSLELGVLVRLKYPHPVRSFAHMTFGCHPTSGK